MTDNTESITGKARWLEEVGLLNGYISGKRMSGDAEAFMEEYQRINNIEVASWLRYRDSDHNTPKCDRGSRISNRYKIHIKEDLYMRACVKALKRTRKYEVKPRWLHPKEKGTPSIKVEGQPSPSFTRSTQPTSSFATFQGEFAPTEEEDEEAMRT